MYSQTRLKLIYYTFNNIRTKHFYSGLKTHYGRIRISLITRVQNNNIIYAFYRNRFVQKCVVCEFPSCFGYVRLCHHNRENSFCKRSLNSIESIIAAYFYNNKINILLLCVCV